MPERVIALVLIVILSPLLVFLSLLLVVGEGWPIFYVQKRVGRKGKIFEMIKFRTMRVGAEKEQKELLSFNEADGPVFKIHNDPRHTKVGRFLFHTGLDELPQLFNILKGEMAMVGPRPLPVAEEAQIEKKYQLARRQVKPGLVSPWMVSGYHRMKFEDWMKSDGEYVRKKNGIYDGYLLVKSVILVLSLIWREVFNQKY
jgi:lipopolysaccharide/colanic/teichoic acid biosynthesis glycosyltransferase